MPYEKTHYYHHPSLQALSTHGISKSLRSGTYLNLNPNLSSITSNGFMIAMQAKDMRVYSTNTAWKDLALTAPATTAVWIHRMPQHLGLSHLTCHCGLRWPLSILGAKELSPPSFVQGSWRSPLSTHDATGSGVVRNENGVTVADLARFVERHWVKTGDEVFYFAAFKPE
jgi:hypothetical protein